VGIGGGAMVRGIWVKEMEESSELEFGLGRNFN